MKKKTTITLIISAFNLLLLNPTFAATAVSSAQISQTTQQTISQKESKLERKASKIAKILQKRGIDLQDPVQKWLWYGIGFLALALLISILGVLSLLYGISALLGLICLVVWFVKRGNG